MKSLAVITNLYTTLSQNSSAVNQVLGIQLMGDQNRYLIQKYFDNERSFSTNTVGSTTLTLSATPVVGDVSATLATGWSYLTCRQVVNFGDGENRPCQFTNGSTTITWDAPLDGKQYQLTNALVAGATSGTLATAWPNTTQTLTSRFSDGTTKSITYTSGSQTITWAGGLSDAVQAFVATFSSNTAISTNGVQFYPIPASISKITNDTVTVGQLKFQIRPIQTRQDWDDVNFLPYNSDIPQYAFIYNGQLGIFPIPSTTGNLLSFNFKTRVPDFSTYFLFSATDGTVFSAGTQVYDYQNGTISGTAGSYTVTGASTKWITAQGGSKGLGMTAGADVTKFNLYLIANFPGGDGIPYPIQSFATDTSLTLALPLGSTIAAGATYTIAQMPTLQEDFHDMLVDGALIRYFTDIVKDKDSYTKHDNEYKTRLLLLEDYAGTKQVNVDLGASPLPQNANLYLYANPTGQ